MFEPYTLYTRDSKKYRKIYYVRFRDPDPGERLSRMTIYKNKKSETHRFAQRYIDEGGLLSKEDIIFCDYTKDWFYWEKSQFNNLKHLSMHIIPYFGEMKIFDISVKDVQTFLSDLSQITSKFGKPYGIFQHDLSGI